jgi:microcystin-dependent protein
MGGSSANRLTDADDGLNGDTLGDTGGGETQILVTGNLPAYTPAGSVTMGGVATGLKSSIGYTSGGNALELAQPTGAVNNGGATTWPVTGSGSFAGTAQGGTSTAFGIVQPTIILNYIIFAGV